MGAVGREEIAFQPGKPVVLETDAASLKGMQWNAGGFGRTGGMKESVYGYAIRLRDAQGNLVAEKYRGIRPAPGYPACPDHAVKAPLFALLRANEVGMTVTESFAMLPAAAVSGFYLSHPDAHYFAVGRIGDDQLADFAQRAGIPRDEAARRLAPNLG